MHILREWKIKTPAEMKEVSDFLLDYVSERVSGDSNGSGRRVIGLYGDLGAGKTAFTQVLARELGVHEQVTSPTFVIMKKYLLASKKAPDFRALIHIDAYRLNSAKELQVLGWAELTADSHALVVIEWPEKVPEIMPKDHIRVHFETLDEHNRFVSIRHI